MRDEIPSDDADKIEQRADVTGQAGNITQIGKLIVRVTQSVDEKVFKRFGIEQRVGFILLAFLVIGSAFALYYSLRPKSPVRMIGDFRVAVAGFAQTGNDKDSEVGEELAQGVYIRLQQTFDELDLPFTVSVWGPDQIGAIEGQDSSERAGLAAKVVETTDADVVVYGIIDTTNHVWQVTPEFYVSTENFYEANEITGQHAIGTPFSITGQGNIAGRIQISDEFGSRVKILSNITIGLAYYSDKKFDKALTIFQSTEVVEGWEDKEGKQVLYLLMGNTAGKGQKLALAKTYFQKSLSLDPEYSRAYIGLASTYYLLALEPFRKTDDPRNTDMNLIKQAITTYEKASKATNQPPLADISTKMHFGLGQCYFMQVYSGHEEFFDKAISEFRAVIEEYDNGTNNRVREITAESHARLGLIYDLSNHADLAAEQYKIAATLLHDNSDRQAQYEQRARDLIDTTDLSQ